MFKINELIGQTLASAADSCRAFLTSHGVGSPWPRSISILTIGTISLLVLCMAALSTRANPIGKKPRAL